MKNLTPQDPLANGEPTWTTQDYHGHQMHVCTEFCAPNGPPFSGHGHAWAYTVQITEQDAGRMADQSASAKSDPNFLYSTRAIAENMGFVKGRELIDGR